MLKRARPILRTLKWLTLVAVIAIGIAASTGWRAMGHRASGARLARMQQSAQWKDGHFTNPQPLVNYFIEGFRAVAHSSPDASPRTPVPTSAVNARMFDTLPASGLRVTWFGHSTTLVEIDGHRILTDPVWSNRVSPFTWIGPTRFFAPLIALKDLPPIDAVVVSHDHYDHLDYPTIVALIKTNAKFVVPLGVGADLEYWGVPVDRIVELDWWQQTSIGNLHITATPARHASGRTLWDKDGTLWAGYAIKGTSHSVFYSGDTGLFPALNDIGSKLGPFDIAMIEVGQYNQSWPDWHSGPEQAVNASVRVRAATMLPVHWALFQLAPHAWTEPEERAFLAAQLQHVQLWTPEPGQSIQPTAANTSVRWWPALPFNTGAQDPINSTQMR